MSACEKADSPVNRRTHRGAFIGEHLDLDDRADKRIARTFAFPPDENWRRVLIESGDARESKRGRGGAGMR